MSRKAGLLGQRTDFVFPPHGVVFQFVYNIIDPQLINVAAEIFMLMMVYHPGEVPGICIKVRRQERERHITVVEKGTSFKHLQGV